MKMGSILRICLFVLLLSGLCSQAGAATITPMSGSAAPGDIKWGSVDNVIDGVLDHDQYLGLGEHPVNTWGGPYTVSFVLSDVYTLTGFNLWNNAGGEDMDGEGVNAFTMNFFDATSTSVGSFSGNAQDVLEKQTIYFGSNFNGVKSIDFVIQSNHPENSDSFRGYALFYEISFEDNSGSPVPEPATMLLFGVGLLGIAGVGRKHG